MRVLGILPFLFFVGVMVLVRGRWDWRESAMVAGVISWVWVAAGTELLSLAEAVTFWPVLLWWVVPVVALGWMCRGWRPVWKAPSSRDWVLLSIFWGTVLMLGVSFIVAARTPPNNADALSYHLPRQVYWLLQGHVGMFPTNSIRMILMPPLAEFAGLHLMILSGGDGWVNLIQWLAFALTAVAASSIARELGCNARLQGLAALLVVTIPTAALEAVNPKNDLVTGFFLCALAWLGLKAYNLRQFSLASAGLVGAACGLLALVKGTGMIFGLPVAAWIGGVCIRTVGIGRAVTWGLAVTVIALAINAGHFHRQMETFGSPLGPTDRRAVRVLNTVHTPRALLSNLARNTAMHLTVGNKSLDGWTTRGVAGFHEWFGMDLNDPKTTFVRSAKFAVSADFLDEDRAKGPLHAILALAAFVAAVAGFFRPGDKWLNWFLLTPALGFALFCWLLNWQEWHSRLHIPVLCLAAAVAPYALGRTWPRTLLVVAVAALALGLSCLVMNEAKPLFKTKRAALRFKGKPMIEGLREAKAACAQYRPRVVGIFTKSSWCEYMLLRALLDAQKPPAKVVKLTNIFPQIKSDLGEPDLVIGWHAAPPETNTSFYARFALVRTNGPVSVFEPKQSESR